MTFLQHVSLKNSQSSSAGLMQLASCLFFIMGALFLNDTSFAATLFPETWGMTASARGAYWRHYLNSDNDQKNTGVASLWLTAKPSEWGRFRLFFDGFIQAEISKSDQSFIKDVREATVEASFGEVDFKVGRTIVVWGRADKINPTDSLSTKNMTLLVSDDEDQRLGIFSTQASYNLTNETRFIAVWQPEWRDPEYPLESQAGVRIHTDRPSRAAALGQHALKMDHSSSGVDWSLSYFNGFNRTPALRLDGASETGLDLSMVYEKHQVLGVDFASTVGTYGLRGEVAYAHVPHKSEELLARPHSDLSSVVGVERSFFGNFSLNSQFLYRRIFNGVPEGVSGSALSKILSRQVALNANQTHEHIPGVSLRPAFKAWNDTLEVELAVVAWFKNQDSLLRPRVSYAISDQLKAIAGAQMYRGPHESFFGRLHRQSNAFAELRASF